MAIKKISIALSVLILSLWQSHAFANESEINVERQDYSSQMVLGGSEGNDKRNNMGDSEHKDSEGPSYHHESEEQSSGKVDTAYAAPIEDIPLWGACK